MFNLDDESHAAHFDEVHPYKWQALFPRGTAGNPYEVSPIGTATSALRVRR